MSASFSAANVPPEIPPPAGRGTWKRLRRWAARRFAPKLSPEQASHREIIETAYRELLRRPADPGGLASYGKFFEENGAVQAVPHLLTALLSSHEFRDRVAMHALDALGAPGVRKVNGQKIAHVVSLGTHCLSGFYIKKYQYKRYSLPFDWLFTSPEAILHLFEDDFAEFLDPKYFVSMAGKRKDNEPGAHHRFYRQRFGVHLMFAHRDPTNEKDLLHFDRAVKRFRQLMALPDGKLFVMIVRPQHDVTKSFAALSERLRAATANSAFICVQLELPTKVTGCHQMRRLRVDGEHALYAFKPSSLENGLGFQEIVDDLMILRLIRRYDIDLAPAPVLPDEAIKNESSSASPAVNTGDAPPITNISGL